jgi:hypothetical protein
MVAASVMDIGIGEEMVGVAPAVVDRLAVYFADVASGLVRSEQRWAVEYYARALMMEGARKVRWAQEVDQQRAANLVLILR